jgi:hypothetical protein
LSGWSTTAPATAASPRSTDSPTCWPNAHLIHLPVHASWLNQVEIGLRILAARHKSPGQTAEPIALLALDGQAHAPGTLLAMWYLA